MWARLRKSLSEANYWAVGLEIVVIILGILVAFQIDRWGQERRERQQEYHYLVRLKEDLRFEINQMVDNVGFAERRIAAVRLLEDVAANPQVAIEQPDAVAQALERATWRSFPHISAFVYTELQNTGNLSLIRSVELRRGLADYYASLQFESRIGLDLDLQHLFDRLTAGILSTDEIFDIEQRGSSRLENEIHPDRALEIAQEFAARQGAVDLLPNIAQHHLFNKKAAEASRNKAQQLISTIDSLIVDFAD